ncbi:MULTISPECIES: hypothetical protein [Aerosakkonema]
MVENVCFYYIFVRAWWVTAREVNYWLKVLKLSPVPNPPYD